MAFSYRFSTLLLLLTLPACEPKDDGSDDTGAATDAGTTTGEVTTSGDASDPTAPSTDPSASGTTATATGSGGSTATATATSTSGDPTVATTGDDTGGSGMTTVATSTSTSGESDTDLPPPVDPPPPCEGEAKPLVGITTTMGYLQSQVPPRPDPTGGTSTTGGGDLDPGTLFVKLSDQNFTCADPNALLACGEHWEVTIVIPPEFQSPGVHNLLGQNVRGVAGETGPDEGGNDCAFGGGSFGATFEILAIDDKVVEGRLCNVESFFSFANPKLEGSFTANRCPQ